MVRIPARGVIQYHIWKWNEKWKMMEKWGNKNEKMKNEKWKMIHVIMLVYSHRWENVIWEMEKWKWKMKIDKWKMMEKWKMRKWKNEKWKMLTHTDEKINHVINVTTHTCGYTQVENYSCNQNDNSHREKM